MVDPHVLGVDPGVNDGAAVLLDPTGTQAMGAWAWHAIIRDRRRAYELRSSDRPTGIERTLHGCGGAIARGVRSALNGAPWLLVEEGLFGRGLTLDVLADARGELCGPLRATSRLVADPLRPRASSWRPAVLSIPGRTGADTASAMAVARVPLIIRGLGTMGHNEHVCEAAAIARWGVHFRPTT